MAVQLFNLNITMTHLLNKKYLFALALSVICQIIYAQFPYYNSAQSESLFKKIEGSSNLSFSSVNGVVLTEKKRDQKSGIILRYLKKGVTDTVEDLTFTTDKGFIIEFEYSIEGGERLENKYGDGFALVLFDSDVENPTLGAVGGGLGYSPLNTSATATTPGFSKGFLGLGFDLHGNYKAIQNRATSWFNGMTTGGLGNYISLRGPYNPANPKGGYPVLFSVGTSNLENYFLNITNGSIRRTNMAISGGFFTLNTTNSSNEKNNTRKAKIALIPGTDLISNRKGFFISLDVKHGSITANVIKNYFFPTDGTIKYNERTSSTTSSIAEMPIQIPEKLKMAFTASTGWATAKQSIKEIFLSLPYSPVTLDDFFTIPISISSSINPLLNDYGFNHNIYSPYNPPSQSFNYIDLESFQFQYFDTESNTYKKNDDPFKIEDPKIGTFTYNPANGEISYVPVDSFDQNITDYKLHYNIKNKKNKIEVGGSDISTEEFRSNTATISISFDKTARLTPMLIINKGIKNL